MKLSLSRVLGIIGTVIYLAIFIRTPSFPTPDKLLILLVLAGMALGQAREVLKRFVPFVALLLVYESFRGLVPGLNTRVNFLFMPAADEFLFFGQLPTAVLQSWWWHGMVQWYDFVFYGAYTLHFVLPFALAVLVWKTRARHYWHVVTAFVLVSFMGFLTFLAFPAAPPWMANDLGLIQPITRVSSAVWAAFGIHDFPSVYNKISPNPVAAVPSLHAAYSALFALYITTLYRPRRTKSSHLDAETDLFSRSGASSTKGTTREQRSKKYVSALKVAGRVNGSAIESVGTLRYFWWLAWVYPLLIWVGTTYMGEHYVIDIVIGIIYAMFSYWAAPYIFRPIRTSVNRFLRWSKSMLK